LAEKIKEMAEGQIYEVFKQKEEIAMKFIEKRKLQRNSKTK